MISCSEAQRLIAQHKLSLKEENIPLLEALGHVNARNLKAPISLPVFDNSAMDGFALKSADTQDATLEAPVRLSIRGVVKAGDSSSLAIRKGQACGLMTGAPIPKGTDAVLAKENVVVQDNFLIVKSPVSPGKNIRRKGEEIKKGQTVLSEGSVINPGTVGFLASMGIHHLYAYQIPKISLVATGSELTVPGNPLERGKIYDSNTAMIRAALEGMRIRPFFTRKVPDRPDLIKKMIHFALKESNILILMGGVSVGDFDYVKPILADSGVETIFWKVSQKPGKPLYFGKKENCLVFGLPGNPASVFTCFYEYVYPAIRFSMGYADAALSSEWIKLSQAIYPDQEKTLFIKARVEPTQERQVTPLKHQQSHMLSSFCQANSFVVVPGSKQVLEVGEKVEVHSLPYLCGGIS